MIETPIPCPFCGTDIEAFGRGWRHGGTQTWCVIYGEFIPDGRIADWNHRDGAHIAEPATP